MSRKSFSSGWYPQETVEMLQDLFASRLSPRLAAEALASRIQPSHIEDIEEKLGPTWGAIVAAAYEYPEHHNSLVELLVYLSRLPPAKDDQGEQLMLYGMRVWDDLPTFGWEINDEWNGASVRPQAGPEREDEIAKLVTMNKFTALMTKTSYPVLVFSLYGLASLRLVLEYPTEDSTQRFPLEASVPAAAIWISIVGPEMYKWTEEFPHGPSIGAPGSGGPLWDGKHGFCEERWKLWRRRFGEIAQLDMDEGVKKIAKQAEQRMAEIESGEM